MGCVSIRLCRDEYDPRFYSVRWKDKKVLDGYGKSIPSILSPYFLTLSLMFSSSRHIMDDFAFARRALTLRNPPADRHLFGICLSEVSLSHPQCLGWWKKNIEERNTHSIVLMEYSNYTNQAQVSPLWITNTLFFDFGNTRDWNQPSLTNSATSFAEPAQNNDSIVNSSIFQGLFPASTNLSRPICAFSFLGLLTRTFWPRKDFVSFGFTLEMSRITTIENVQVEWSALEECNGEG